VELNIIICNIAICKHLFMLTSIRKFLFRCEECGLILSVEFEDEDDIEMVQENKVVLECQCSGYCKVLMD